GRPMSAELSAQYMGLHGRQRAAHRRPFVSSGTSTAPFQNLPGTRSALVKIRYRAGTAHLTGGHVPVLHLVCVFSNTLVTVSTYLVALDTVPHVFVTP